MREATFSPDRAVEAVLYLSKRVKAPTIHEVLKLRYFADKLHMETFGFLASGDKYFALEFGPVASQTYDLLKAARGQRGNWIPDSFVHAISGAIEIEKGGHKIRALRDANTDLLTEAEIACMDRAIERWGNLSFEERTNLSHDAAYDRAWDVAIDRDQDRAPMSATSIAETLENAEEVISYMRS